MTMTMMSIVRYSMQFMAKNTNQDSTFVTEPRLFTGLGRKFVLIVVFILSTTLSATTALTISNQNKLILQHLNEKAQIMSQSLSMVSVEAILVLDYDTLNGLVRNVSRESDVIYAVVYDEEKQPMTSYLNRSNKYIIDTIKEMGDSDPKSIVTNIENYHDIIHIETPVKFDGTPLGYVSLGISKEQIQVLKDEVLYKQISIDASIIIFLSLCIYLVFWSNVLQPVKNLIEGAVRVTKGKLEEKVEVGSTDEMGSLTMAFNDMMGRLNDTIGQKDEAMQKLTELNKTYEERVIQRTSELKRSEARTRAILDNIGEGIVIINDKGFIESVNPAAMQIFGYGEDEIGGIHSMLLLSDIYSKKFESLNEYYDYTDGLFSPGKSFELAEYIGQRKDGSKFPIELSVTSMEYDKSKLRVCIVRDITERKQTDDELKRHRDNLEELVHERTEELAIARDQATQASKLKSAFLANMSHEIRTPLTSIIGFAETSLESDQTIEERQQAISTIVKSGKHLLQIINDILDLSKIEADKLEVENIEVSPFEILSEVRSLSAMQAKNKGLSFSIEYIFPLPAKIFSDPVRLRQILINLCSNAIKFTDTGYIKIVTAYDEKNHLMVFDVVDTGIGMTDEQILKIFDAFSQADSSTTRKYGGTGLGLSLSKMLTVLLGGSLSVSSQPGAGSCFSAKVFTGLISKTNYINSESEINKINELTTKPDIKHGLSGNILLAEDTPENQKLISLYIKKLGAHVTIANDGKEAVEIANCENFDLILMDMQMPVMDGIEAVKTLRENKNTTPIIALTANAMMQDRDRCLAAGCNDFLTKPIDRKKFENVLSQYLLPTAIDAMPITPIESLMKDEEPVIMELIQQFLQRLKTDIEMLKQKTEGGEWQDVKQITHNIKGGGGGFGYPILSEVAAKIQFQLAGENYSAVRSLVTELDSIYDRIDKGAA